MSTYMTEEEQLEAIKKWWRKYNNLITIILSVVLLVIAGYRYWGWHQDKLNKQASTAYEHMMLAFSNQDSKLLRSYANQLIREYGKTVYADAARLALAKYYVEREKESKADEQLVYVANHSQVNAFKQIAKLRMVRLLIAKQAYEKALHELTMVDDPTYVSVVNELKGDIFAATGKYQEAKSAYKDAIKEMQTRGVANNFLEMKLSELSDLGTSSSLNPSSRIT